MQLNKELEKLRADKAKAEKELEYLQHRSEEHTSELQSR